jgi:hypothetical protein
VRQYKCRLSEPAPLQKKAMDLIINVNAALHSVYGEARLRKVRGHEEASLRSCRSR